MSRIGLQVLLNRRLRRYNVFTSLILVKQTMRFHQIRFRSTPEEYSFTFCTDSGYYVLVHNLDYDRVKYSDIITGDAIIIKHVPYRAKSFEVIMEFNIRGLPVLFAWMNSSFFNPISINGSLRGLWEKLPKSMIIQNMNEIIPVIKQYMARKAVRDTLTGLAYNFNESVLMGPYPREDLTVDTVIENYNKYAIANNLPRFKYVKY